MNNSLVKESLSPPWRGCIEQAWEAYCAGSLPIGAVITDKNGRIIANGRNRLFEPTAPHPYLCNIRMAHAEINALLAFSETGTDFSGTTIYTSLEPCPMCLGAIRMYRIGGIAYAARDHVAGSISLANATYFFRHADFDIHPPPSPNLEYLLLALLAESTLRLTDGLWLKWREKQDSISRSAIQLARKLHAANRYPELIKGNASVWPVLAQLSKELNQYQ